MPMSRSMSSQSSNPWTLLTPSGWSSLTIPRPLRFDVTGASSISASARTSSEASRAPLPTAIIGFFDSAMSLAAAEISSKLRGAVAGVAGSAPAGTSTLRAITSHGISTDTGPRRPLSISRNALSSTSGVVVTSSMRAAHLVSVCMVASWLGSSWRWPRRLPMKPLGTCPVTQSTGSLQPQAVHRAPVELSTPGPGTTQ